MLSGHETIVHQPLFQNIANVLPHVCTTVRTNARKARQYKIPPTHLDRLVTVEEPAPGDCVPE